MAEDNGSKDRATVALVAAKLDGLSELTKAGFVDVQRQLDALVTMPEQVVELRGEYRSLERRVSGIEDENERNREWKRGPLLVLAGGSLVALVNLLPLFVK